MSRSAYTILVVDDSCMVTASVEYVLQQAGYRVRLAEHAFRALEILHTEDVDLILLDEVMPDMTGRQLCRHIRDDATLASIPVVFVTGKAAEMDEGELQATLGVRFLLGKPVIPAKLLAMISQWRSETLVPS